MIFVVPIKQFSEKPGLLVVTGGEKFLIMTDKEVACFFSCKQCASFLNFIEAAPISKLKKEIVSMWKGDISRKGHDYNPPLPITEHFRFAPGVAHPNPGIEGISVTGSVKLLLNLLSNCGNCKDLDFGNTRLYEMVKGAILFP